MSEPSADEQYMLELINAERAQAGVQPLADNAQLNAAAGGHSQWMIDSGVFSHTGAGGSTPTDRMVAAGFQFTGAWSDGENIAMTGLQPPAGLADEVAQLNTLLMNSPGHRANLLNPTFTEVGLGLRTGAYQGQQAAFVTEDFAQVGAQRYLTGVAYDDADHNHFYTPGEGLGGLTVTAVSATGQTYAMQTYGSGGYDLALPSGSYTVTFSGGGIATTSKHVDVGAANVQLDLVDPAAAGNSQPAPPPPAAPAPAPADGLIGGAGADSLVGLAGQDNVIRGGDGNDTILGGDRFNNVNGNKGDDSIVGRSVVGDWLRGGQGDDRIDATASSGHNIIAGNLGNDTLHGGSGGDTLRGGQGDDLIVGGSGNDWLSGDAGHDTLTGGAGADTFHVGGANAQTVITDFSFAQGDRVLLDPGSTYTVAASGSDTLITLGGGTQIVLQNVATSSLPAGAILLG